MLFTVLRVRRSTATRDRPIAACRPIHAAFALLQLLLLLLMVLLQPLEVSADPQATRNANTLPASSSGNACFSLKGSRLCPAFSTTMVPVNITYAGKVIKDVTSFDEALELQLNTHDAATDVDRPALGCQNWSSVFRPRYITTITCRNFISDQRFQVCAQANAAGKSGAIDDIVTPQMGTASFPVCRQTCEKYVDDWTNIISDPTTCNANSTWINSQRNSLSKMCNEPAFNKADSNLCISGEQNEPTSCGFVLPTNEQEACNYCSANPDEPCCKHIAENVLNCTRAMATAANQIKSKRLAIVLSAVSASAAGLAVLVLAWRWNRKRKQAAEREQAGTDWLGQGRSKGKIYRIIHGYRPGQDDEMLLEVGDIVEVSEEFSDGWGYARNYTNGQEGMMPMGCASPAKSMRPYQPAPWLQMPPPNHSTDSLSTDPSARSSYTYAANPQRRESWKLMRTLSIASSMTRRFLRTTFSNSSMKSEQAATACGPEMRHSTPQVLFDATHMDDSAVSLKAGSHGSQRYSMAPSAYGEHWPAPASPNRARLDPKVQHNDHGNT